MAHNNLNIGKPGPFQVVEAFGSGEVDSPIDPPRRKYDCENYETCLDLAAALNWDNFTCRGCNAEVNQSFLWRAHQAKRKDAVAESICEKLPRIGIHHQNEENAPAEPESALAVNSSTPVIDLKA